MNGYQWIQAAPLLPPLGPAGSCLVPVPPAKATWYNPLTCDGLYLRFAHLDRTEDAVRQFADQYGWLGSDRTLRRVVPLPIKAGSKALQGEFLDDWLREIGTMRLVHDIYQALSVYDLKSLRRSFEWLPAGLRLKWPHPDLKPPRGLSYRWITTTKIHPHLLDTWQSLKNNDPNRLIEPARWYVCLAISEKLLAERVTAWLAYAPEVRRGPALCIAPGKLLGCLWLQFARDVEGQKIRRKCRRPGCPRWVTGRADAKFCSPTCKGNFHRDSRKVTREV